MDHTHVILRRSRKFETARERLDADHLRWGRHARRVLGNVRPTPEGWITSFVWLAMRMEE